MKSRIIQLALAGAFAGLLATPGMGCAAGEKDEHEQTISLEKSPAAVREAVAKAIGDNKLDKLSRESEDGKAVYEAEFHDNGVARTVTISEAGAVLEDEQQVDVADLPDAVRKAVDAKHPGAKLAEAELVRADGATFYEIEIADGKNERELKVTTDGQVTSDQAEDEEDEADRN